MCTHQAVPHRITEHPDLELTHKDQLLVLHTTPQNHTMSPSAPDHPHNIHQTLEPGLSSEFNHHGTQAGMDSCAEKTPKKDIVTTVPWLSCCLEHLGPYREDLKTWLLFVHLGEA